MIVFSPLFFIVWLAVRLEDGGPAIFSQQRVGYRGREFTLYKFRSMVVSSEADGQPALCQKNDARLTRVGRFLRDHHLDELPQLWNVLRGDMSFVGPRPERRFFVERIMAVNPDYELLYQLRPGLFSSATLYNGYTDTTFRPGLWYVMPVQTLDHIQFIGGMLNGSILNTRALYRDIVQDIYSTYP